MLEQFSEETMESKETSPSYLTRVRLMDQGTFGCIYRPEIECGTGSAGDYAYVSKVQKMTRTIQNEIEIGNIVKQIPHYMFWYSPLLNTCPISFSTLKKYEEEGESCNALKAESNPASKPQFISSKIRYAGKYIIDYLDTLPPDIYVKKVITTYAYLDAAITRLYQHGIIHNDIKENNVLYDLYNHSPNIIDFGISYKISDLEDESKESAIFYTTKFYPYWCIQIYLLCVYVAWKAGNPTVLQGDIHTPITEQTLTAIYESYITEFQHFAKDTQITRILTQEDMEKHKASYWTFVRPFLGKSWSQDLRPALLQTNYQWDKYSLAIMYMAILGKMETQTPENTITSFIDNLRADFVRIQ